MLLLGVSWFKLGQKRAKESHFHVGQYSFAATAAAAAQSVAAPAPDVMAPPDQPVAVAVSLRDWLVHDAHVSQRLLDGIIATLTYRKVSTVDGLSRLHAEVGLQDVIKGMAGSKVAAALHARTAAAAKVAAALVPAVLDAPNAHEAPNAVDEPPDRRLPLAAPAPKHLKLRTGTVSMRSPRQTPVWLDSTVSPVVLCSWPGSTPRSASTTASRAGYNKARADSVASSETAAQLRQQALARYSLDEYRACGIVLKERRVRPE